MKSAISLLFQSAPTRKILLTWICILGFILPMLLANDNLAVSTAFKYELTKNGLIGRCGASINDVSITAIRSFDINDQYLLINAVNKILLLNKTSMTLVKIIEDVKLPNGTFWPMTRLGDPWLLRFDVDGTFFLLTFKEANLTINTTRDRQSFLYHLDDDGAILDEINLTSLDVAAWDFVPVSPYLIILDMGSVSPRLEYINLNETPLRLREVPLILPSPTETGTNNEFSSSLNDNETISIYFNHLTRTSLTTRGFGVTYSLTIFDNNNKVIESEESFLQVYEILSPSNDEQRRLQEDTTGNFSRLLKKIHEFQLPDEELIKQQVQYSRAFTWTGTTYFDLFNTSTLITSYFGDVPVISLQPNDDTPLIGWIDTLNGKQVSHKEGAISISEIRVDSESQRIFLLDRKSTQCIYAIHVTNWTPENFSTNGGTTSESTDIGPLVTFLIFILVVLLTILSLIFRHPIEVASIITFGSIGIVILTRTRKKIRNRTTAATFHQEEDELEFGDEMTVTSTSPEQTRPPPSKKPIPSDDEEF